MDRVPPETRALRQMLTTGLVSFLLGLICCLALLGYLWHEHFWSRNGWWSLLDLLRFLMWSAIGGLATAAGATYVLTRWHYGAGVHRCPWCNRLLRRPYVVCVCRPKRERERAQRLQQRPWFRHHRRRIRPVLLTYASLLPLAIVGAATGPGRVRYSLPIETLCWHAGLCIVLLCVMALIDFTLESFKCAPRYRTRAVVFRQTFAVWPVLSIIALFVIT